ncbi:peptidoglycan DD-metalloendopeptidase family protein [Phytohabitans sp. ZYX-F-186]|uniref:Peptidoglycan DD-metalloendopeptidase family protein n=1 Tax=Phytohabitans maris TaxID=3071409 RepID=A0ABU0Z9W5_9ACTN|nr:peptidoglycan DD-metalloendopeptidase family protein [Phytohabitans sp. ZYX-F-186]MDQ7903249.1 peptidoglycan DD-metalloendopeptidase family protein [Phytohabitans sp. ZYX-F-186]
MAAVVARLGKGVQVSVAARSTSQWGFGTAVRPAPAAEHAYPEGWLFVAKRQGGGWRVALEGEAEFATLGASASILSGDERRTLGTAKLDRRAAQAANDRRTGMRLPFALGQTWRYTGGPHPMNGSVRSSIDMAGGDGKVLAARAGVAYTMCKSGKGWVRVVHDRGFATDYYHLEGNIKVDGQRVAEGTFLGNIGNDVSCGGRSTGKHVHFSLRRDGAYVAIDRYAFGKWVILSTGAAYEGAALHGSKRVAVGGGLYNYGALGLTQGVVDTDGGARLNRRSGPGTNNRIVGKLADGDTVTIACSARGTRHTGRNSYTTDLWNRLTDGSWVSDAYVWTGTGSPVNGNCT